MSIDAQVTDVVYQQDGSATLVLCDAGPGRNRGQGSLSVVNPNPHLRALIGMHIWGNSESIVIGSTIIAKRIGYTRIRLTDKPSKQSEGKTP